MPTRPDPVVHLELHTGELARACDFYGGLFGWPAERIGSSYTAIGPGRGAVECPTRRPRTKLIEGDRGAIAGLHLLRGFHRSLLEIELRGHVPVLPA